MRHLGKACLSVLLAALLTVGASAATAGRFLRGKYEIQDGLLRIFCTELPAGGKLTASVGTQKDVPAELTTVAASHLPTTVYCLVDVSGSIGAEQLNLIKETLQALSDRMENEDNMVITLMGETVEPSEPLTDPDSRREAIQALPSGSGYTNLYAGVIDGLQLLETSTKYHSNRCLVILSDGQNDHRTGSTETEAMSAIESSAVPIYAVATLPPNPGSTAREYGKLLRSFASTSLGGMGCTPVLDGISGEDAGAAIWDSLQNNAMITIPLKSIVPEQGRDTLLARVTYETQSARYEDTVTLYAADLPEPEELAEGAASSQPVSSASGASSPSEAPAASQSSSDPAPSPGMPSYVWLIAGLSAVGVLAIIVIAARKKKKQSEPSPEEPVAETAPETVPEEIPPEEPEAKQESAPVQDEIVPPSAPDCTVRFTAINYPDRIYLVPLMEHRGVTVGRDDRADVILDGTDGKLSGVHCALEWDGSKLYIQDQGSTNGSFVNGVPIQGKSWMPLENGAAVRIGAYEYHIEILPKE